MLKNVPYLSVEHHGLSCQNIVGVFGHVCVFRFELGSLVLLLLPYKQMASAVYRFIADLLPL